MNKRTLSAFCFISLNGFYKGVEGDISWHRHGAEESDFSLTSLQAGNILLFGRVTYEMMYGWWPTESALKAMPEVAGLMNDSEKIVFSNTLVDAPWKNSTIMKGNVIERMSELKKQPGKNMTILGSGSIVKQFAENGLIDVFQVMIDPVAIGEGVPLFDQISNKLDLQLTGSRVFSSGTVLLTYVPIGASL